MPSIFSLATHHCKRIRSALSIISQGKGILLFAKKKYLCHVDISTQWKTDSLQKFSFLRYKNIHTWCIREFYWLIITVKRVFLITDKNYRCFYFEYIHIYVHFLGAVYDHLVRHILQTLARPTCILPDGKRTTAKVHNWRGFRSPIGSSAAANTASASGVRQQSHGRGGQSRVRYHHGQQYHNPFHPYRRN